MPSGRQQILRGVPAAATGALPQVNMSAADYALAGITRNYNTIIRHSVNANHLDAAVGYTVFGAARGSGKAVTAVRDSVAISPEDPDFNGHDVFNFTVGSGSGSDLKLDGNPTTSCTWFAVASISAALKASPFPARLITLMDPATSNFVYTMTMLTNGNILMGASGTSGLGAQIPVGMVPDADTPFVICGSYGYGANRMRLFLNNNTLISAGEPTVQLAATANHKMGIGGNAGFGTINGWLGQIARVDIFDFEMTTTEIAVVMAALVEEYDITV